MTISRRQTLQALAAAALVPSFGARAQAGYPDRPVSLVVGYSAGGAVDAVARTLGQSLSSSLGQPFVIDNKPGAGTNIAVKYVIDAKPDGHTLLLAANALAANMALYKPQPFDAEKDLVAVSLVGRVPVVIAANAAAPYGSIKDLVAAAKAKPNSVAYASPGNGSTPHMAAELFARAAGIDLMHVPYRGGAQAITDVIGGQVPVLAMNALEVKPQVASGKLKVLAVLSPQRSPIFPDVPTIAESGFSGFEASVWYAVMAPARTPMPIVEKLHAEVQKALATPQVRERMTAVGGEVIPGNRDMVVALLRSERQRYDKLVREANIKPD
ncbi:MULTISPECIES: Bug family tripartite tricarboxylate transporter substrate binding protein [Ramlibacter]|uniref:Tripartite tricarboxylate transporter substrate binding protein n=1 Tax=Ramlibacter pinisoli TaxID=2682844 RepID=A0A6N8IXZ6_9BURK|nr:MULTISPECIES: tripartite tricarboxylate transporter substrate binding protein [Ramlibacter]MBA2961569.1 tripartite tricarboxylate transporter substrate binding protein [Ramlibacter sp. CGMCC 1.13660]MVQ31512.1 tripartite tricarboxylate transporter substrate binding protein [Ramlibacter pinisoli]